MSSPTRRRTRSCRDRKRIARPSSHNNYRVNRVINTDESAQDGLPEDEEPGELITCPSVTTTATSIYCTVTGARFGSPVTAAAVATACSPVSTAATISSPAETDSPATPLEFDSDLAYSSHDDEEITLDRPSFDFNVNVNQSNLYNFASLSSPYHGHDHQSSGQPRSSVLSPRRSSRLLEKRMNESFATTVPSSTTNTATTSAIADFYFFQQEQRPQSQSIDSTSDYGTLSVCSTSKKVHNLSEILSDEISNMSLEDAVPTHPTLSSLSSLQKTLSVRLVTIDNFHILLPEYCHRTRDSFTDDLYPSESPKLIHSDTLTAAAVEYFAQRDTLITPSCVAFQIILPRNYLLNVLHPPIVSAPINIIAEAIQILQKVDSSEHWTPLFQTPVFALNHSHISFEFEANVTYLLISKSSYETVKKRGVILGQKILTFHLSKYPKITINFPKFCVDATTATSATLYFSQFDLNCGINQSENVDVLQTMYPLASPILSLTPHGLLFNKEVTIEIEVIHYKEILKLFNNRTKVMILQSKDSFAWTPLENFSIIDCTVTFKVCHFSFFKVVWDLLSNSLTSAKMGISTLLTSSVPMKCQSTMDQYENNRFALEISVYRADKAFPEVQNYSHIVGRSFLKLIKPGRITLALKSSLFEADVDAGEDKEMIKEEDFTGQDFSKDFALKFNIPVKEGPFGKVLVTRHLSTRRKEIIFDFTIQKQGNENENTGGDAASPGSSRDRWSTIALQELATSLFVTDGENWKLFAKHIGHTKQEIKMKFKNSSDPFLSILESYKARGGTPEEFIKSLYEIHREIKINLTSGSPNSLSSRKSACSTTSSGIGSSSLSNTKYKRSKFNPRFDEEHDDFDDQSAGTDMTGDSVLSRAKRPRVTANSNNNRRKRRKFEEANTRSSDEADNDLSSSEDDIRKASSNHSKPKSTHSSNQSQSCRKDMTKLEPSFLWDLSAYLTNNSWKALGRTLQLEESYLINIDQNHRSTGNRECYFQVLIAWKEHFPKKCTFGNLYNALVKENMVAVAKKMSTIQTNQRKS